MQRTPEEASFDDGMLALHVTLLLQALLTSGRLQDQGGDISGRHQSMRGHPQATLESGAYDIAYLIFG